MIGITVTYETYDDEPETISQKYYFNISKREWMEMQIADESMSEVIQKIIDSKSNEQVVNYLKQLVLKAYGIRTLDESTGKMTKFRKSEQISQDFEDSAAFDKLIENLTMTNEDPIVAFITGILPKEVTGTEDYQKLLTQTIESAKTNAPEAVKAGDISSVEAAPAPQPT